MTRHTIFPEYTKEQEAKINDVLEARNHADYQCYLALKDYINGIPEDEWQFNAKELVQRREELNEKFLRLVAGR